jgi:hypothetical protein
MKNDVPRLMTLRTDVFVVGAILGAEGRTPVLRLGLRDQFRDHFEQLLRRVADVATTVAQLANPVNLRSFSDPTPWRPRRRRGAGGALPPLAHFAPS